MPRLDTLLRPLMMVLVLVWAATASAQVPADVEVRGRVVDVTGGGAEPVTCCDVVVRLHPADPRFSDIVVGTQTRADGTFAVVMPCTYPPTMSIEVTANTRCCGGTAGPITIIGCTDGAGTPHRVDFGDVPCVNRPNTGRAALTGLVNCRRGPFLEPVEDCSILIRDATGAPVMMARTDARGRWETCVPCSPTGANRYMVTAQCCDQSQDVVLPTGCGTLEVPTFTCDSCPVPPCPNRTEVEIVGQVVCLDPAGGFQPVPDCLVQILAEGPDTDGDGVRGDCGGGGLTRVRTGPDGRYRVCFPCPVDAQCGSTGWTIETIAYCCNIFMTTGVDGCAPTVDQGQLLCGGACPPPTRPCGIDGTQLHGRLTCVDGAGIVRGVPDCTVSITGCSPAFDATAVTDSDGNWSACMMGCGVCTTVTVQAECCAATQVITVWPCPPDILVDLRCTTCPPRRPCPPDPAGNESTQVSGQLLCRQGGIATPIAGCDIEILWYRGSEPNPVSRATAVTDGDGRYVACLPCGDRALPPPDLVVARALCCDAESRTAITACPPEATLDTIYCADCSPCPTGSTRVQGKIVCRGGGPVVGCAVVVTVETCTGSVTFTATTDSQGRYVLCVPCPCPGRAIRIEAACCGSSRTIVPSRCGPVTPIPTMFCRYPCP